MSELTNNQINSLLDDKQIVVFSQQTINQRFYKYLAGNSILYDTYVIHDPNSPNYIQLYNQNGILYIGGSGINAETILVSGVAKLYQGLEVSGFSTFLDSIIISGNILLEKEATFKSNLSVSGVSTFSNFVNIQHGLTVSGTSTFTNHVSILNGGIQVTGNSIFNDSLLVKKELTISGFATFNDELSIGNIAKFTVSGNELNLGSIVSSGSINIGTDQITEYINIGNNNSVLKEINIGSNNYDPNPTTINIGGFGDIVNINGSFNYISVEDLVVQNKQIVLNAFSGPVPVIVPVNDVGILISNGIINNVGYIKTDSLTGNYFVFKAPDNNYELSLPILSTTSTVIIEDNETKTTSITNLNVSGNAMFFAPVQMNQQLYISGNQIINNGLLNISGGLRLKGDGLFVTGDVQFNDSNFTLNGTMNMSGNIIFNSLQVSGNANFTNSKLVITGGVYIQQQNPFTGFVLTGNAIFDNSIVSVSGSLNINGEGLRVTGNAVFDNSILSISGSLNVSGTGLKVTGNAVFDNSIVSISGGINVSGEGLTVTGNAVFDNSIISVSGTLNVSGNGLRVTGKAVFDNSAVSISGTLNLSGNSNFDNSIVSISGALNISGTGLTVTGNAVFDNSIISVSGCLNVSGQGLKVTGNAVFDNSIVSISGALNVSGEGLRLTGNATFNNSIVSISGSLNVSGTGLRVTGNAVFDNSIVSISGALNVSGEGLRVTGNAVFDNSIVSISGGINVSGEGIRVTGNAVFDNSIVSVSGALNISGTGLRITGNAVFDNSIVSVSGSLNVSGEGLRVTGNAVFDNSIISISGGLNLSGQGLRVTGNAVFDNSIVSVSGALNVSGTGLKVTGNAVFDNSIVSVSGTLNVSGTGLKVTGNAVFDNSIVSVSGALNISGQGLRVTGNAVFDNSIVSVSGALNISGQGLRVTGNAVFDNSIVSVSGTLNVSGTGLRVTGNAVFDNSIVSVSGTLNVSGNSNFNNSIISISGGLNLSGQGLMVTGNAVFDNSIVSVSGALNINGEGLRLTGNATFNNSILSISGELNIRGEGLKVTGNAVFNGYTIISGSTDIKGFLEVSGNAIFNNADISVSGLMHIENGGLLVEQPSTFNNTKMFISDQLIVSGTNMIRNNVFINSSIGIIDEVYPNSNNLLETAHYTYLDISHNNQWVVFAYTKQPQNKIGVLIVNTYTGEYIFKEATPAIALITGSKIFVIFDSGSPPFSSPSNTEIRLIQQNGGSYYLYSLTYDSLLEIWGDVVYIGVVSFSPITDDIEDDNGILRAYVNAGAPSIKISYKGLYVSGTTHMDSNVSIQGTLVMSGSTIFKESFIEISGGSLNIYGNNSVLSVTGDANFYNSNNYIDGSLSVSGPFNISGSGVRITGNATFNNSIVSISGAINVSGIGIRVTGNVNISNDVVISGNSNMNGELSVSGLTKLRNLNLSGNQTISGNFLQRDGNVTFNNSIINISGFLGISGSGVVVTGNATFSLSRVNLINSHLSFSSGNVTFFSSKVFMDGELNVTGISNFTGNTNIDKLHVNSSATFNAVEILTDLVVNGGITFINDLQISGAGIIQASSINDNAVISFNALQGTNQIFVGSDSFVSKVNIGSDVGHTKEIIIGGNENDTITFIGIVNLGIPEGGGGVGPGGTTTMDNLTLTRKKIQMNTADTTGDVRDIGIYYFKSGVGTNAGFFRTNTVNGSTFELRAPGDALGYILSTPTLQSNSTFLVSDSLGRTNVTSITANSADLGALIARSNNVVVNAPFTVVGNTILGTVSSNFNNLFSITADSIRVTSIRFNSQNSNMFFANGGINIDNNGYLTVTGTGKFTTLLADNFNVTDIYANGTGVFGNLHITSNAFISNIDSTGLSNLNSLIVSGFATFKDSLSIEHNLSVSGTIHVDGDSTIQYIYTSGLTAMNYVYLDNKITISGSTTFINKNIFISGGNLLFSGNNFYVTGNVSLQSLNTLRITAQNLNVLSSATFLDNVNMNLNLTVTQDTFLNRANIRTGNIITLGTTNLTVNNASTFNSNLYVSGFLGVNNGLTVTGIIRSSGLLVTGDSTLKNINVQNIVTFNKGIFVSGSSTFLTNSLYLSGSMNITGNVIITGSTLISDNFDVGQLGGSTTFHSPVYFLQTIYSNGGGAIFNNTPVDIQNSNLTVSGVVTITSNTNLDSLNVRNQVTMNNGMFLSGNVTFNNSLLTLSGSLEVTGLCSLNTLIIRNQVTLNNSMFINNNLYISGNSTFNNSNFSGLVNIQGALAISGGVTLTNLYVTNNANVDTLQVRNNVTFNRGIFVSGNATFMNSNITISGDLGISGDLDVSGVAYFNIITVTNSININMLNVSNKATFASDVNFQNSNVTISGYLNVQGTGLNVSGGTTFDQLYVSNVSRLNGIISTGNVTFDNAFVSIDNGLFVEGSSTFSKLYVDQDFIVNGNTTFLSDVCFSGVAKLNYNNYALFMDAITNSGTLAIGTNTLTKEIKIGSSSAERIINIGGENNTINFVGNINFLGGITANDMTIQYATVNQPVIVLNTTTPPIEIPVNDVGILISNGLTYKGYIKTDNILGDHFVFKSPHNNNPFELSTPVISTTSVLLAKDIVSNTLYIDNIDGIHATFWNLDITENVYIRQHLFVTGTSNLQKTILKDTGYFYSDLNITGSIYGYQNIVLSGNAYLDKLYVTSDSNLNKLFVIGKSTFNDNIYIDTNLYVNNNVNITGVANLSNVTLNNLNIKNNVSVLGNIFGYQGILITGLSRFTNGSTTFLNSEVDFMNTNINVSGNATFTTILISGLGTIKNLHVLNFATFANNIEAQGNSIFNHLTITGNFTANKNAHLYNLEVEQLATFTSGFKVLADSSIINSTLHISGNFIVTGGISISGSATFSSINSQYFTNNNTATFLNTVNISGTLNVRGTNALIISGLSNLSRLIVSQNATFYSDISVSGTLYSNSGNFTGNNNILNVNVLNFATFNNGIYVSNTALFENNNLIVSGGGVYISGAGLYVTGPANFSNLNISDKLTVINGIEVLQMATFTNGLYVSGKTNIEHSYVNISGIGIYVTGTDNSSINLLNTERLTSNYVTFNNDVVIFGTATINNIYISGIANLDGKGLIVTGGSTMDSLYAGTLKANTLNVLSSSIFNSGISVTGNSNFYDSTIQIINGKILLSGSASTLVVTGKSNLSNLESNVVTFANGSINELVVNNNLFVVNVLNVTNVGMIVSGTTTFNGKVNISGSAYLNNSPILSLEQLAENFTVKPLTLDGISTDISMEQGNFLYIVNNTVLDKIDNVSTTGINGYVNVAISDKLGNIYIGGSMTMAGGILVTGIAKWDGQVWSGLGNGIQETKEVFGLAIDSTNNIYVGGNFTLASDLLVNYIAKWDGSSWNSIQGGANNTVRTIVVDSSDNVYIGGDFLTVSGGDVLANRVAKWNGTNWNNLNSGLNASVHSLALDSNNTLYAGGEFTNSPSIQYVAKWDNSTWIGLGSGLNGIVRTVVTDNENNVYVGGDFTATSDNSLTLNRVAKWNGISWVAMGLGINYAAGDKVNSLVVDNLNNIYALGEFGSSNEINILYWNGSSWNQVQYDYNLNIRGNLKTGVIDTNNNFFIGGKNITNAGIIAFPNNFLKAYCSLNKTLTFNNHMRYLDPYGNIEYIDSWTFNQIGQYAQIYISSTGNDGFVYNAYSENSDLRELTVLGNATFNGANVHVSGKMSVNELSIDSISIGTSLTQNSQINILSNASNKSIQINNYSNVPYFQVNPLGEVNIGTNSLSGYVNIVTRPLCTGTIEMKIGSFYVTGTNTNFSTDFVSGSIFQTENNSYAVSNVVSDNLLEISQVSIFDYPSVTYGSLIQNNALTIKRNGHIGINKLNPTYDVDISGSLYTNNLIVNGTVTALGIQQMFYPNYENYYIEWINLGTPTPGGIHFYTNLYNGSSLQTLLTNTNYKLKLIYNGKLYYIISNYGLYNGNTRKIGVVNTIGTEVFLDDIFGNYEGGTFRVLVDKGDIYLNSITGNVGIGTTGPTQRLDVNGKIKSTQVSLVGYTNIIEKYPILGVGEFAGAQVYTTISLVTDSYTLINTPLYNPFSSLYDTPSAATGSSRLYRLYAVSCDNIQNLPPAVANFKIQFNFANGTPSTVVFNFMSKTSGDINGRRSSYSDIQTITNTNNVSSVQLIIPNGVIGKASGGGNMASVSVKISYLEIQYIDQY